MQFISKGSVCEIKMSDAEGASFTAFLQKANNPLAAKVTVKEFWDNGKVIAPGTVGALILALDELLTNTPDQTASELAQLLTDNSVLIQKEGGTVVIGTESGCAHGQTAMTL
jgi:hypothetical protein